MRMMAKAVSVPLHRIEDSETLLQCGYDAFRRRDFKQSAAAFRRATKVDPSCAEAHIGLGNLLYRRGNYTGAEHHYREAGPRASWGLSLLLEKRGDLEAAIDVMEEYLRSEALPILTVFEASLTAKYPDRYAKSHGKGRLAHRQRSYRHRVVGRARPGYTWASADSGAANRGPPQDAERQRRASIRICASRPSVQYCSARGRRRARCQLSS